MATKTQVQLPRVGRRFRFDYYEALKWLLALLVIFGILFPIWWLFASSLKPFKEQYTAIRRLWPIQPTIINYIHVLRRQPEFLRWTWNSIIVTLASVALTCLLATTTGYGFARIDFKGRDLLFYSFIATMFIPRSGGLMAQYELMEFLHLRNSILGLVLAFGSGLPVPVFIMRQTFLAIPHELEEAGRIDGAGTWQVFWKIALPMSTSGMIVVAILRFVQVWGNYLFVLTMIDDRAKLTAAVGLGIIRSWVGTGVGYSMLSGATAEPIAPYGVLSAANVVVMLPVVIFYLVLQKWFVRGLTEGILKF